MNDISVTVVIIGISAIVFAIGLVRTMVVLGRERQKYFDSRIGRSRIDDLFEKEEL